MMLLMRMFLCFNHIDLKVGIFFFFFEKVEGGNLVSYLVRHSFYYSLNKKIFKKKKNGEHGEKSKRVEVKNVIACVIHKDIQKQKVHTQLNFKRYTKR